VSVDLYCGDCRDVLATLPDASVDAVVTDPPYNVGFTYENTDDRRPDYREWCASWFAELKRICRGPITLSPGIANVAMWCGIEPPRWIFSWWKPAAMGRCLVGFNNWEPMLLWGKPHRRNVCDVVRATIKPDPELAGHPCPKPLDWGLGFVERLTKLGMTVLDPFAGSGTVGVACFRLGRRFIGIEQHRPYFDIAARRIEAEGVLLAPPLGPLPPCDEAAYSCPDFPFLG
jgi:site-specific DNA-methyltransferase (adenine-specific)